jgi:hypothetical protein
MPNPIDETALKLEMEKQDRKDSNRSLYIVSAG